MDGIVAGSAETAEIRIHIVTTVATEEHVVDIEVVSHPAEDAFAAA
jgi:hypothetical protein